MKIASVKFKSPTKIITNQDILEMIERSSREIYSGDMQRLLLKVEKLLDKSGIQRRRWLAQGEKPLDLLTDAVAEALNEGETASSAVDMVIYAGVDRGFVEPGDAYFLAQASGLLNAKCFDIVDACNSWARALYIASRLIEAGDVKNALIINAEFYMRKGGCVNPQAFQLTAECDLDTLFPAYTLGEGATATLVNAAYGMGESFQFRFSSRPDLADLCAVPLNGFADRALPSARVGRFRPLSFSSFGVDLFKEAVPEVMSLFAQPGFSLDGIKAVFTHSATYHGWVRGLAEFGLSDKMLSIYPEYGNIAAASIPGSIATALSQGAVLHGDPVLGCVASAGMSFSIFRFLV